jgi:integrase/recombinase XerC
MVKLARVLGLIPWNLEIESLKSVSYLDTRGPGLEGFHKMLESLESSINEKAVRDRAILRLLFGMALRRAEVTSLDLCHVDEDAGRLAILGKGHSQREILTVPPKVLESIKSWIAVRGDAPGALFHALDHAHRGHRLDGSSIYRMISDLGKSVGMKVRPHGLRHAAITTALDVANGNARAVQRFSRHARLDTLHRYDDNRADLGGQIAYMVDQES